MIADAQEKWDKSHPDEDEKMMLPLIRLKVSSTVVMLVVRRGI
jgi:hypothetical protein